MSLRALPQWDDGTFRLILPLPRTLGDTLPHPVGSGAVRFVVRQTVRRQTRRIEPPDYGFRAIDVLVSGDSPQC